VEPEETRKKMQLQSQKELKMERDPLWEQRWKI
jgi:hypothetical protein